MVNITFVDWHHLATSLTYAYSIQSLTNASTDAVSFISYTDKFTNSILGANATSELILHLPYQAFHEAGAFYRATGKLYASSNWANDLENPINVTVIDVLNGDKVTSVRYDGLQNANGGATMYYADPEGGVNGTESQKLVFCDQGDFNHPAQLIEVDPVRNKTKVLLDNFLGRNFSSINDVTQHPVTGDLYFTDVPYAYWQDFRPPPELRPQVYRFSPTTGVVVAVADDFVAPNGVEFSPDGTYLYVTDTGKLTKEIDATRPSSIYRFEVTKAGRLRNRELFAYVDTGFPDGIHTDTEGNVWSGCGDGINVWDPEGVLLGKLSVGNGGSNNFAFIAGGIYVFNNYRLFKVGMKAVGRNVRKDFGV
ncbi:calcium-dependent phosphotriesterase [Piedraia hortae CBS 480.64]|uniref:Calcium-dependent phosphotriesterase n=1 Tax=Piedraia hortae CBS 480.64 TaxID=1314780 RepID=A0A6A7C885_9PEZI|nr:calcium-dependent phosphotriesterase [Piedraia hortae CBS 480.64]